MARAFAKIAFTPNVQAMQSQMGSRQAYRQAEIGAPETPALGPLETEFITERDSFYQATVGENGWPYVQHRGGPQGFLKVLDEQHIGYADFSGNRQYISVGNLSGDNRVSLFLMDYQQQRRLKIWGRARLVDESLEPELLARLETPSYRARVERGIVIEIEAYDWNCPKYITPRYSEAEVEALLQTVKQRLPTPTAAPAEVLGKGPLPLVVSGIRQLTPQIRAYELRHRAGDDLPPAAAGAHLVVPLRLADGQVVSRQYSLSSHAVHRDVYEIAVLREADGRGGSLALQQNWQLGTALNIEPPDNQFPLHDDARPAVLIAGGIGITPVRAMAQALRARQTPFTLHYSGRLPGEMAYRAQIASEFPAESHFYFTRLAGQARPNLSGILQQAPAEALIYVCGPTALIEAVVTAASRLGIPPGRVQFESFV